MNFNNFFKDKKGNYVIIQKPNLLIFIAIFFFLLQLTFNGQIENIASWGFKIAILFWSLDEALRGDSLFRKVLGIVVMVLLILIISLYLI